MSKHKELLEAIERSRGRRIFESVENLITTFYIVEQNHKQLWEFLGLCDKKDFVDQLNPMHAPQKLSAYVNELSRLLHNFVAATKTLIDHTRNHINDLYENLPFYDEYQAKLKSEIADKPLRCFVQDLRNYTLHKNLPVMNISCGIKNDVFQAIVVLDAKTLLQWKKWDTKSIEYIKSFNGNLPIDKVAKDYLLLIKTFYDWFACREIEINRADIDEANRMLAEYYSLIHPDLGDRR